MLKIYEHALAISAYIKHNGLIEIRMFYRRKLSWKIAGHSMPIIMNGDLMIPKQAIGCLKYSEVFNHAKGLSVYRRFMRSLECNEVMPQIYAEMML
jgi:hypothetical protein